MTTQPLVPRAVTGRARRRRFLRRRLVVFAVMPAALLAGAYFGSGRPAIGMTVQGPADGAVINAVEAEDLEFRARLDTVIDPHRVSLWLNGRDVTADARISGRELTYAPGRLPDGDYRLDLRVNRRVPMRDVRRTWTFLLDATAPDLKVTGPTKAVIAGEPVAVTGRTDPDADLTANGREAPTRDGRFRIEYDEPSGEPVVLVATDAAGNTATKRVDVPVVPSRVTATEIRAVHVSFWAWATDSLREPVLEMAERGQINAVQLDLKDESGVVGYDSRVPLARRIGAAAGIYDLAGAVEQLHDRGVHVIGRLVAFRDPVLAEAAWESGDRDLVLQTPDGAPYAGYGGFTNFAHPRVRRYNIAVAKEAAAAGVDAILYDYIRRPDGPVENLSIPGLRGKPSVAVAAFLRQSERALEPYGVDHGASVYGIAATRPDQIAQDIPAMARHVDYVAPMLYPSHWADGEYDVPHPNSQPYDIVHRSLVDFQKAVRRTDARVVPWLQDFSLGVDYGPAEVRAQLHAARDVGIDEWIMWDPNVTYTTEAYPAG